MVNQRDRINPFGQIVAWRTPSSNVNIATRQTNRENHNSKTAKASAPSGACATSCFQEISPTHSYAYGCTGRFPGGKLPFETLRDTNDCLDYYEGKFDGKRHAVLSRWTTAVAESGLGGESNYKNLRTRSSSFNRPLSALVASANTQVSSSSPEL